VSFCVAIGPSSFAEKDAAPLRMLEEAGCVIKPNPFGRRLTEEEIIVHLEGVDGLIAGLEPLNRRVIASAPQLKAIARVGIGMTNVDFGAAEEFGVQISNTPDAPAQAVAELTVTCLLTIGRGVLPMNAALHEGEWKKTIGFGLIDRKVLLVGLGRIGRKVAELLAAFGARVYAYDPHVEVAAFPPNVMSVGSLDEGLAMADVISLHASGAEAIIGDAEFDRMRDGIVLLNCARGELVDEQALVAALDSGKVGGAWFDTFWEEPYAGPLTDYDNVILTPHVGTYTEQCRRSMETAAVRNLLRDLGGTP